MARVTYGESITEYAGSIGGVTFLRNASGPIAKLRSSPPVNPSPYQSTYQGNLATLVAFWPTLSQEIKHDWDVFAAAHPHTTPWGVEKTLSGYQWFVSVNLNRLFVGKSILPSPPFWVAYSPPGAFTSDVTPTYINIHFDVLWTPDTYWVIYASLPLRQSSLKLRRSLFFVLYVQSTDPVLTLDFTSYYIALVNIVWATFYASADCSIIVRLKQLDPDSGLASAFRSAIVKIG